MNENFTLGHALHNGHSEAQCLGYPGQNIAPKSSTVAINSLILRGDFFPSTLDQIISPRSRGFLVLNSQSSFPKQESKAGFRSPRQLSSHLQANVLHFCWITGPMLISQEVPSDGKGSTTCSECCFKRRETTFLILGRRGVCRLWSKKSVAWLCF